ncbi:hypothetical protein [Halalkalibacter sp. APA_J-10(15)]|uniref:hypothetical protein n=1 Tax=unclassified Halalkalibacter TaxID=2893063 RepID=UPI001FF31E37|nr:hypothetical protein [Halalkalibacter sp. APA_J-10(15)]MCK0473451.1 hypothetical protein [Halalkalibacter sp. APA_J-10(15)]
MNTYKLTFYFNGGENFVFEVETGYELHQQVDKIQNAKWFDAKSEYVNMDNVTRFVIEER